jgi:hypothetical protein
VTKQPYERQRHERGSERRQPDVVNVQYREGYQPGHGSSQQLEGLHAVYRQRWSEARGPVKRVRGEERSRRVVDRSYRKAEIEGVVEVGAMEKHGSHDGRRDESADRSSVLPAARVAGL